MGSLAEVRQLPSASPRCVLVGESTGDSRLAVAVAAELIQRGSTVVIVGGCADTDCVRIERAVERNVEPRRCRFEARSTAAQIVAKQLTVSPLGDAQDLETALDAEPVSLRDAHCLLALSEDRDYNLRAALVGHRVAPGVPVVLRAFDPDLAEELERAGGDSTLSVRRAYSVSHLSAPSFVAGAVLREGSRHLLTMRAGVQYVSVCQLPVAAVDDPDPVRRSRWSKSRGLLGRTPQEIAEGDGCQVLARRSRGDGVWHGGEPADKEEPLALGDEVIVGGPLSAVLELARGRPANCISRCRRRTGAVKAKLMGASTARQGASARGPVRGLVTPRLRDLIADLGRWSRVSRTLSETLSVRLLIVLGVMVTVASVIVTPGHRPSDLLYQWASTALGNPADTSAGGVPEKVVAALGLLAGGLALGLGTSLMSTALIQRRLMEGMRRRARRLKHHVIIVGLGGLSARVAARLRDVGIHCAIVDPSAGGDALSLAANPAFMEVAEYSPILTGELGEALARARVDRADALIALSEDNLANVEACIRAKRQGGRTRIRTVARIFDDSDAIHAAGNLGVDKQIAAVKEVAPAFADAALEELPTRTVHVSPGEGDVSSPDAETAHGALRIAAVRWGGHRAVNKTELECWHREGIRVLGPWQNDKRGFRPRAADALEPGDLAVLTGPPGVLSRVVGVPMAADPASGRAEGAGTANIA
jgi:Trk K+ transport system NAD-binding subunit